MNFTGKTFYTMAVISPALLKAGLTIETKLT